MVPKPSEQRSSATVRTNAKEVLISQTCNNAYKGKEGSTDLSDLSLNQWLDDMAIQQGVNKVSCQVTVIVVVIDIDVSSTLSLSSFLLLSFSLFAHLPSSPSSLESL